MKKIIILWVAIMLICVAGYSANPVVGKSLILDDAGSSVTLSEPNAKILYEIAVSDPASSYTLVWKEDGVTTGWVARPYEMGVGFANPMTTLGDMIYGTTGGVAARLIVDTSTMIKYLRSSGEGSAPTWNQITASDIASGVLGLTRGGTGQSTRQTAINALTNVSAATIGYVLTKDGSSSATFQAPATGVHALIDSINTVSGLAAGRILQATGAATYGWSTPTYPSTAGTAGKILISNGTNFVSSTPTYPNASATAGKVLRSDGTNFAASQSTFADTFTANSLLFGGSLGNAVSGLATGNSGVLITSSGGVPSISTDIPSAVTIGGKDIFRVEGPDVPIADGGTGASNKTTAFNALSPMTTLGDMIYESDVPSGTRLPGNITTTRKFLRQVGGGSTSNPPAWDTIVAGDLPINNYALANVITVAKSGGDYTTIQAAVNAATAGTTILVYPGTYNEKVIINKSYVSLIGVVPNGNEVTWTNNTGVIVTWASSGVDLNVYTMLVASGGASALTGIVIANLTIINTSPLGTGTAQEALNIGGGDTYATAKHDVLIKNCSFYGEQDTIFVNSAGNVIFDGCYVEGHNDIMSIADDVKVYNTKIYGSLSNCEALWFGRTGDVAFAAEFHNCIFSMPYLSSRVGRWGASNVSVYLYDCISYTHDPNNPFSNLTDCWDVMGITGYIYLCNTNGNFSSARAAGQVTWLEQKENLIITNPAKNVIGSTTGYDNIGLYLYGNVSPATSATTYGMRNGFIVNPLATYNGYSSYVGGTINKTGSGTHSLFASLYLAPPTIGAGASTLAEAATLYISGAPTTATTNYAIHVASGVVELPSLNISGTERISSAGIGKFASLNINSVERIDSSGNLVLATTMSSSGTAQGRDEVSTAGENLIFGNVCYYKSDGKLWKADATTSTTTNNYLWMAMSAITANTTGKFMRSGTARSDSWSWTVGGTLYLSTAGTMTQTAPSSTNNIIKILGVCRPTSNTVYFEPSADDAVHN